MQVILGSGGAIGIELAKELKKYTSTVRLASRNPQKINDDDKMVTCDLSKLEMVENAVAGCEVAYLVAGLPYRTKVWQYQWPLIMKNVIDACKKHNTKLVFFDNIYMYNPNKLAPMTEQTEFFPSSKKGKVRAQIAKMILDEISSGELEALIARSADFYGPGIKNSVLNEAVFNNLKNEKKANWFCSTSKLHNFTFTPDAAKATALLGNTNSAFGQTWHLPTATPISGKEWIVKIAKELGAEPKIQVAPTFLIRLLGLFNPIMKEFVEMLYQYNRDYDFNSSKFENAFKIKPTSIDEGIKQMVSAG